MGLNPFWLSWCYSLQISKGDGRGVWGEEKGGKVYGKGVGAKVTAKQSPKLQYTMTSPTGGKKN